MKPAGILGVGLLALIAGAGCETTVTPTGTFQDNFFVTWEIDSLRFGPISCASVGATTVDLDLVNVDSGARFVFPFACDAFAGTSGPVDVGRFDVLIDLTDPSGGVIDQVNVGAENLSTAGTVDLGHVIFSVP